MRQSIHSTFLLCLTYNFEWYKRSEVHKALHKAKGTPVALKRILMHNEKEGMPITALREIKILKALQHPCIIDIFDMFVVRSECSRATVFVSGLGLRRYSVCVCR